MNLQQAAAGHLVKAPARKHFGTAGWHNGTIESFMKRRGLYRCVGVVCGGAKLDELAPVPVRSQRVRNVVGVRMNVLE